MAAVDMNVIMTNDQPGPVANVVLNSRVSAGTNYLINGGTWQGWISPNIAQVSFQLPWGISRGYIVTNASAINQYPWLVPQTHTFQPNSGFYVPHWWLNLNACVRFILVDTEVDPPRIIDYVNIKDWERTLDVTAKLTEGAYCSTIGSGTYNNPANHWCVNRLHGAAPDDITIPTYGIMNQIGVGLLGTTDWSSFSLDPYAGNDAESAVDGFRYNLKGWSPIYPKDQGKTFYRSNVFFAPFAPYRPIFIHTSGQANDPLVHYQISDLTDPAISPSNRVNFVSHYPPLDNLGLINDQYQSWGGNPLGSRTNPKVPAFEIRAKDPGVTRPDVWVFPSGQPLSSDWLGRVHRGTPWQTLYLKSGSLKFSAELEGWRAWVGIEDASQADLLLPTRDWRLASELALLFNSQRPQDLASANQTAQDYLSLLDGLIALTNTAPWQFEPIVISADSPQAATIAAGILQARANQPGQVFHHPGDMFSTPELSLASPYIDTNFATAISDQLVESIPSGLLSRLRLDSVGTVSQVGGALHVQFTGFDSCPYAVETSSDLIHWISVSTNYPIHGVFTFSVTPPGGSATRFYRSVLLP